MTEIQVEAADAQEEKLREWLARFTEQLTVPETKRRGQDLDPEEPMWQNHLKNRPSHCLHLLNRGLPKPASIARSR